MKWNGLRYVHSYNFYFFWEKKINPLECPYWNISTFSIFNFINFYFLWSNFGLFWLKTADFKIMFWVTQRWKISRDGILYLTSENIGKNSRFNFFVMIGTESITLNSFFCRGVLIFEIHWNWKYLLNLKSTVCVLIFGGFPTTENKRFCSIRFFFVSKNIHEYPNYLAFSILWPSHLSW